jgi:hypothetical protein
VAKVEFDLILRDRDEELGAALTRWLRTAFPTKFASLSDGGVQFLIARAREWAGEYGLVERGGAITSLLVMMLSGSYADRDPLRPWIGAVLRDSALTDPTEKARALHEGLRAVLRRFATLDRFRDQ